MYGMLLLWSLYTFAFLLGVFGNVLIIVATWRNKRLRIPTNAFVCNLCLSDVLILCVGVPLFAMDDAHLGASKCTLLRPLLVVLIMANVLTLVTIAVERNLLVLYPIKLAGKLTFKYSFVACLVLDAVAVLVCLPVIVSQEHNNNDMCVSDLISKSPIAYVLTLFLFQYAVPFSVMTFLYIQMWRKIRKHNCELIEISQRNRECAVPDSDDESTAEKYDFRRRKSDTTELRKSRVQSQGKKRRSRSLSSLREVVGQDRLSYIHPLATSDADLGGSNLSIYSNVRGSRLSTYDNKCGSMHSLKRSSSMNNKIKRINDTEEKEEGFPLQRSVSNRSIYRRRESVRESVSSLYRASENRLQNSMSRIRQSLTSLIAGTQVDQSTKTFALLRYKQTLKTLKIFAILLLVFLVCMLPHHVVEILQALDYDVSARAYFICKGFIYLNAFVNPWLYGGLNPQFQASFRDMFKSKANPLFEQHTMSREGSFKNENLLVKLFVSIFSKCRKDNYDSNKARFCREQLTSAERKASNGTRHEYEAIPTGAPIIIITCYDDEVNDPFLV